MKSIEIYDSKETDIRVYDRYTIIINGHIYTMSSNPGSPQGACIYHGTVRNVDIADYLQSMIKIDIEDLPDPVQEKINQLLAEVIT